jgi:glycosyltransferase involved in cell wall biosynthesis
MRPYLLGSSFAGCNYVRIQMPAWANGWLTNKKSLRKPADNEQTISQEIQNSDLVVFHRPESDKFMTLAKMCKKDGKKIVMDNDDTFFIDGNHPLAELSSEGKSLKLKDRQNAIIEFLKIADLVTCSTETLAREYREYNDNVVVLPNCVDPDDWDEPLRNEGDKVRIGIVGSAALEYDYQHIKDIIKELSERDDVELVMFGLGNQEHREKNPLVTKTFTDEYTFWDSVNYEHFPWCPVEDYMTTLNEARLDFMLIPRQDNYFNRCKSNLKFLEASMCEIPVIAQSFEDGPYEELKVGDIGILVKDNADWMAEINKLINNKNLRRKIGRKAKEYVLNNYNIADNAYRWEQAYQSLYD